MQFQRSDYVMYFFFFPYTTYSHNEIICLFLGQHPLPAHFQRRYDRSSRWHGHVENLASGKFFVSCACFISSLEFHYKTAGLIPSETMILRPAVAKKPSLLVQGGSINEPDAQ